MEASAAAPDWLAACRRIAAELRAMLAAHPEHRASARSSSGAARAATARS